MADIRCYGWLMRQSLYVTDGHLMILEHEFSSDRVRRIRYEHLEHLLLWRRMPMDRIIIVGLLLGLPALLLILLGGDQALTIIGGVVLVVAAVMLWRYIAFKRTYIRLSRGGHQYTYATISSPDRVQRFRDRVLSRVELFSAPSIQS